MYQFRRSYPSKPQSNGFGHYRRQQARLSLFKEGEIVKVMDLKPEPPLIDYHRRQSWLVCNFVGRVVSSTQEQLVLMNFRTGHTSTVYANSGYTLHSMTEEQWAETQRLDALRRENKKM